MKFILLIGVFQALFFTILILQKKQKAMHDYILAAWLSFLALFIGIFAFYTEELFNRSPYLISSYISLLMVHGPFLYFYTLALMSKKDEILHYKSLWHLLPVVLFNVYLAVVFSNPLTSGNVRLDYVTAGVKLPGCILFSFLPPPSQGHFISSGTYYCFTVMNKTC
jgi:hypothetical protein